MLNKVLSKVLSNACKTLLTGAVLALIASCGASSDDKTYFDSLKDEIGAKLKKNTDRTITAAQFSYIRKRADAGEAAYQYRLGSCMKTVRRTM